MPFALTDRSSSKTSASSLSSGVDWNTMFTTLNKVRQELMDVFPYKTILIDGAEADDIIGCIARNVTNEKILILSSDKDFIQLHTNPNVKQYSPVLKKFGRWTSEACKKENTRRADLLRYRYDRE